MKPKAKVKQPAFSRLSAAGKRIAICEDILKQIAAQRYQIEQGTWLSIHAVEPINPEAKESSEAKMLQNVLLGGKHTMVMEAAPANCTCCAVGAACASAIRLFNQDVIPGSMEDGYELQDYDAGMDILRKYFPQAQVDLIEAAFEQRVDGHHETATEDSLEAAVSFGENHEEDDERLIAICKNITKNRGTFKP